MNRDTAVRLASAGLFLLPCKIEKTPAPRFKWKEWATNDPAEVAAIWDHYGDCAPAIYPGPCGLVFLDLDRKHGKDGVAAFDALLNQHGGDISTCPITATPSGGYHVVFRKPLGLTFGNVTGSLPPGIDIRSDDGYALAPDAVLSTGEYYESVAGHPDLCSGWRDAPFLFDWIVDAIELKTTPTPMGSPLVQRVRMPVTDGSWNKERADAYMRELLDRIVPPLAAMLPHTGRNNELNNVVMRLSGTLANPTMTNCTFTQQDVWDATVWACTTNSLMADDGGKQFAATFRSAWSAGQFKPCRYPLPDPPDPFGGAELNFSRKGAAA